MSEPAENSFAIKTIKRNHYEQWLPLWQLNNPSGIDDRITAHTWKQMTTKKEPVEGLGIFTGPEQTHLAGFLHYILHPVTGQIQPVCYMQDLFIAPDRRQQGLARHLLNHLTDLGKEQNWCWIYWTVMDDNIPAQKLYQSFGVKMPMSTHLIMPGMVI